MRPFSNLQNDLMPRFLCCETIFIRGMVNLIFRWRFPLEISVAFYAVLVLSARHFLAIGVSSLESLPLGSIFTI